MKKILTLLTLCILSTYARADIILKPTKTLEEHALLIIPGPVSKLANMKI